MGFTGGFVGTAVNGGSLGDSLRAGVIGGLIGGVTAGFANGIGDAGQYMGNLYGAGANLGTRVVLHGGLSSFMSKAQGGRWSSGFWSGAVGTYLNNVTSGVKGYYENVAKNAIIGGTLSSVTGGKFANGAALGAFRYMFNDASHDIMERAKARAIQRSIRTAQRNHHPTVFEKFNGTCTNEKYIIDATGARVTRDGYIISSNNYEVHGSLDEIGLYASSLGAFPTPLKPVFGGVGMLTDILGGDWKGLGYGILALTGHPGAVANDLRYGYEQAYGSKSYGEPATSDIFKERRYEY